MNSFDENTCGLASEVEYDHAVALMNRMLNIMGDDERHPLARLLEVLAAMVGCYDKEHFSIEEL